jgi:hypothetical protein
MRINGRLEGETDLSVTPGRSALATLGSFGVSSLSVDPGLVEFNKGNYEASSAHLLAQALVPIRGNTDRLKCWESQIGKPLDKSMSTTGSKEILPISIGLLSNDNNLDRSA